MKYTFPNVTEEKLKKGKLLIEEKGGEFYTDGTFKVKGVEGKIDFSNGSLTIDITDKPWLASWDMIETELNKFFK